MEIDEGEGVEVQGYARVFSRYIWKEEETMQFYHVLRFILLGVCWTMCVVIVLELLLVFEPFAAETGRVAGGNALFCTFVMFLSSN